MSKRFSDREDVKSLIKDSKDFHLRSYGSYIIWISVSLIIMSMTVKFHFDAVAEGLLLDEGDIDVNDILIGVIAMVVASSVVGGYLLLNIFRLRSIIDAIEFQSIIFSSSMRAHSLFSFIVNKDHTVVYMDFDTQKILDVPESESLDEVLDSKVFSTENKSKILKSVSKGKSDEITISYKDEKGKAKDAIVTIDCLPRPDGYFTIRGYSLKENRF